MSPLTKLFVGLHVILSAMLVAGVIVFVNKSEDFRAASDAAKDRANRAEQKRTEETAALNSDLGTYKANAATLVGTIDTLKASLATAQQTNNTQVAGLADMSSKMSLQMAENAKLAEGIKASQDAQTKLSDAVTELRKDADARVTQGSQLNAAISDLTNKLEVTERERKFLAEQLTQARSDNDKMMGQMQQAGIRPEVLAGPTAAPGGTTPPINGVIRDVDQIAGSLYATISVGSADSVAKGMQFNVVERGTGKFLGQLTVTAVEANEATGRVSGPAATNIQPGAEVKTQL